MARKKPKLDVRTTLPKMKISTRLDPTTVKGLKQAALDAGESIEATIAKAVESYLRRR